MSERAGAVIPARILVVEDEADLREAVAEYLSRNGFLVRSAADAGAARTALGDQPADVVLLDLNMPGEDGLSLARWLRAQPACPGIIMVTAASDLADRVVGLEIGADDYLGKPFALRELLARVRALSREQLLDLAHDKDSDPFDRSIDVRITRIRRKIEVDPAHPRIIRTVRGTGYVFRPGDEE